MERGVANLPFSDESPAIRYLEHQGSIVLNIRRLSGLSATLSKISSYGVGRVNRSELAEFLNNMGVQLGAGVSILEALDEIIQDTSNKMLRMTLKFIRSDIVSGQTFAAAMARHPGVFPPMVINLARIGEETGNLDSILLKASEHLRRMQEIISSTKRALIYPLFLITLIMAATIFWFWYVVPNLLQLFLDMDVDLPLITRALIKVGEWTRAYLGIAGLALTAILALTFILRRGWPPFRYATDYLLLKLPLLRSILETSMASRISEYLGILLGAGIGVLRSFDIISDATPNTVYKKRLQEAKVSIKSGNNISSSMRQSHVLPSFAIRMINIGEQSGRMEEQTGYVAKVYREKLTNMVEVLGKTLEPALLVFMGLIFGVLIAGLLLPVYDLISEMNF
ncbi:type II secretion system F family protein [Desulfonatronum sp. SC1]|uniref:type II secretion system F family protein n=1 Tax=Desulfonatronum sp. SC1 TaxID=2109626 RepID=UPI0013048C4C|nr:type II secretion system F family protein [Desulfonatronum sp. SC1]